MEHLKAQKNCFQMIPIKINFLAIPFQEEAILGHAFITIFPLEAQFLHWIFSSWLCCVHLTLS